ncbi:MAG: hypothetical protein GY777_24290 [Candidatus Brocadiaceae bacterium]|nr:hypothetical protein [Candidatus Brocadiaceae bacterium]
MEEKILTFGKHKINVTDTTHGRIEKAKKLWSYSFELNKKKIKNVGYYNKKANKIGSYLLNENFFILLRTLPFGMALKECFKRFFILNSWYINNSLKKEYDEFHNWISKTITGFSLDEIKKNNEMEQWAAEMYDHIMNLGYSKAQCQTLLTTFLLETAGKKNI